MFELWKLLLPFNLAVVATSVFFASGQYGIAAEYSIASLGASLSATLLAKMLESHAEKSGTRL